MVSTSLKVGPWVGLAFGLATSLLLGAAPPAVRGARLGAASADDVAAPAGALAVARALDQLATELDLWPGFDPRDVPLALYDGEHTWLLRHPSPPAEYAPVEGSDPPALRRAGRDPAVSANTSAELGGVATATLMLAPMAQRPPDAQAAVAVHEAFHVFQATRMTDRAGGDEGALFTYPLTDGILAGLRRLEEAALARALAAQERAELACWARRAVVLRDERFGLMAPEHVAYERGTEFNEGLATYVELRAAGEQAGVLPDGGYPVAQVRHRAYGTGAALALVLDRLSPSWRGLFQQGGWSHLDGALRELLPAEREPRGPDCGFDAAERERLTEHVPAEVTALIAARAERRRAFDARGGWRVVIEAPGEPLWPQGFDPLNVEALDGGVLHTRYLVLGNGAGRLDMLDEPGADVEALSEGAGAHPLYEGVRRVEVTGPGAATVEASSTDRVRVEAPGFTAEFQGAAVETRGGRTVITLGAAR